MDRQSQDAQLRVSIVVGGRFHACDLARELSRHGALHRLVIGHPKHKVTQFDIPAQSIDPVLWAFVARKATARLVPRYLDVIDPRIDRWFARDAADRLQGSTLVHGWAGYALESLEWAKARDIPCVIERSSAHLETQFELLGAEYEMLGERFRRPPDWTFERQNREYELADLIAVPSSFALQSFLDRGFDQRRLLYAPFGSNLAHFSPGAKSDDVFRVVYAGNLSIPKGIHYLVEAYEQAAIPNSELCLIGTPTKETPFVLSKAGPGIRCLGHLPQDELTRHYRNGSVFAIASIHEGMALVQAQALASGLPLVCTTNSGGEDLLQLSGSLMATHPDGTREYPAGFVVPIRRPDVLASCFRALATTPELLAAKRAGALALRDIGLSWESYGARMLAAYRSLV